MKKSFYLLCGLLATALAARAQDALLLAPRSPAEAAYRQAFTAPAESRARELEALRAQGAGLPADALTYATARLGEGDEALAAWTALAVPGGLFAPEALEALALASERNGDWSRAAGQWDRRAAEAPDDRERSRFLGRRLAALERAGDAAASRALAVRLWMEFSPFPEGDDAGEFLARTLGDPLKELPAEALYTRGKTLLDGGSREKAVSAFTALRSRGGKERRADAALGLGKALHFLRRYEESLLPLEEAARLLPDGETAQAARFWRARSLFGLDRGDVGARDLVAMSKKWPQSAQSPQWLLQAYRVFQGRSLNEEAAAARKRLFERHSGSDEAAEVRWTEAWRLYESGNPAQAAQSFEKAVSGLGRGWLRAGGLFWAFDAARRAGDAAGAQRFRDKLLKEFPVGWYARLARNVAEGRPAESGVLDPRGRGDVALSLPEFPFSGNATEEAAVYLRLGLPQAARRALDRRDAADGEGLWLRYLSGDFHKTLELAGCEWTAWPWPGGRPGPGGDACRVSYAPAYPQSVAAAARESGVHPHLLLAVARTESAFDPVAYSPWEARGLMQFIPATARLTARELDLAPFDEDMLFDPPVAFRLGARHLRELLDRFDGDVVSAVAAYNAGAAAVDGWRAKWRDRGEAVFVENIPYRETRKYVKKVLTALDAYGMLDAPGLWKQNLPGGEN